jgi:hypothetical protein
MQLKVLKLLPEGSVLLLGLHNAFGNILHKLLIIGLEEFLEDIVDDLLTRNLLELLLQIILHALFPQALQLVMYSLSFLHFENIHYSSLLNIESLNFLLNYILIF